MARSEDCSASGRTITIVLVRSSVLSWLTDGHGVKSGVLSVHVRCQPLALALLADSATHHVRSAAQRRREPRPSIHSTEVLGGRKMTRSTQRKSWLVLFVSLLCLATSVEA